MLVPVPDQAERQRALAGRSERYLEVFIDRARRRVRCKCDQVALIEYSDRRGLSRLNEVVQERVAMRMARHQKSRIG